MLRPGKDLLGQAVSLPVCVAGCTGTWLVVCCVTPKLVFLISLGDNKQFCVENALVGPVA